MSSGKRLPSIKSRLFLFLLCLCCHGSLVAESELRGKSYDALLKNYGEPVSKQEYEVKRREVWKYKNDKAYLEQGRIVYVGPPGKQKKSSLSAKVADSRTSQKENMEKPGKEGIDDAKVTELFSAFEAVGEAEEDAKSSRSKRRNRRNK